jgi:hypothetical protein
LSFQAVVEIPTSVWRWKSYPSYEDSDIEWLGKIPAHWEAKAVWILFRLGRGRVISNEEILDNPGPFPVYSSQTENEGIMGYINTYDFDGNYITLMQELLSIAPANLTVPTFVELSSLNGRILI